MKDTLPIIMIRYAIVLLFTWFAVQQMLAPGVWTAYLPTWTGYLPIPAEMLIRLNGWTEFILAVLLAVGCYTRIIATILGLHLIGIAWTAGGAVGVRDAALAVCTLALAVAPPDPWTLDDRFNQPKSAEK